jgi:hypothetical protein
MQRRQILAAVGALLPVGCLGAKRPGTAGGVRTEGEAAHSTETPTLDSSATTSEPTATSEPTTDSESTETPEPGPTEAEVAAGTDAIDRVQSAFVAAVEAYTGRADGAPVDVPITSAGFDARQVLVALDAVQRELAAAGSKAATDEQRDVVADLRVAERFLTESALAHSYFAESAERLDATAAALPDDVDEAERAESRFDASLKRASARVSTLSNDVDADPVAAAEPFDGDSYGETMSAFRAARTVFEGASSGLDRIFLGLDELEEAREAEDDGDDDEAEEKADEAREWFDEAYDFFADAAAAADDAGIAVEALLDDLTDLADERYVEADDLYDDVS